jgi:hypothetical protein
LKKCLYLCLVLSLMVRSSCAGGDQTISRNVWSETIPESYFGMHIHKAARAGSFRLTQGRASRDITRWPSIPFGTWRLWDAGVDWAELEPSENRWDFDLLDSYVELAEQHHVEILLTLGQTPRWTSARPDEERVYDNGNASEPLDIETWKIYVATVAKRYRGRSRLYEIWNEPNLQDFYTGNIQNLVELTKEASEVLHQIDPKILVVSPSVTRGPRYMDDLLALGMGKYVDIIGFHFYVHGKPEDALPLAEQLKQALSARGLTSKPIWDTEQGWGQWKDSVELNPDEAANFVARAYIVNWLSGIRRLYWYSWDNHWWVRLDLTEADNLTETSAALAYRTIHRWLLGASIDRYTIGSDGTWSCHLTRNGIHMWIAWNPQRSVAFRIPREWNVSMMEKLSGSSYNIPADIVPLNGSPILFR